MPLTWKAQPLTMEWCLDCHRHPEKHLRPKDEVFNMDCAAARTRAARDRAGTLKPGERHPFRSIELTNCSMCHR